MSESDPFSLDLTKEVAKGGKPVKDMTTEERAELAAKLFPPAADFIIGQAERDFVESMSSPVVIADEDIAAIRNVAAREDSQHRKEHKEIIGRLDKIIKLLERRKP